MSFLISVLSRSLRLLADAIHIIRKPNPRINSGDVFRTWTRFRIAKIFAKSGRSIEPRPYAFSLNGHRIRGPIISDLREMFHEIFVDQIYLTPLPPRANIIDCGANVGCSAVYFKLSAPDSKITCFEPNPLIFPYLEENISGLSDVKAIRAACGKETGTISFLVDPTHSTGSTSKDIWSNQMQKIEATQVRLSDYVTEKVDLLKLDVEGAELDVLEDLEASGKLPLIDRMSIEFHHNLAKDRSDLARFLAILERSGFAYTVDATRDIHARFDNEQWQGMMIYAWRMSAFGCRLNRSMQHQH